MTLTQTLGGLRLLTGLFYMRGYKGKEEHAAKQIVILRKGGREYNPCSQEDKTPLSEVSRQH